ncbi:MAG: XrtA-associated tyrosine autokinase [Gammaproteobacteria bacterium]|nr:XrtA-associated tyrosine autokinase [Gammaproteobacteria bacterium]
MDNKSTKTTIARLVESGSTAAATNNSGSIKSVSDAKSGEKNKNKVSLHNRLKEMDMLVVGSNLDREMIDDYRRVKRPLVSNACGKNKSMVERGNIILVTSSIPGEGKTYTSVNLALSMAQELDNTVLLVDCDVAKQGVSRMLGLEKVRGLVDVLENDDLSINDVLLQTDIPNFRVMSAGKQNEYVTELLASHRMSDLVEELATRYSDRIIIFDGPPLLPTPQTQVLAGLVGQVVFVIEAGKTSQSLVEEALELIPEEQATGIVMNKNEGLASRSSYYYGYYGPNEGES